MQDLKIIDLRSDTLTLPDGEMLKTISEAPLGDDGRINEIGTGEDPTVTALEELAARLTGKEAAALFCSGTLANLTAILTHCNPGSRVLVDEHLHAYRSEGGAFKEFFGHLSPVFYSMDSQSLPDPEIIKRLSRKEHPSLLCIENTHNYYGGICLPPERLLVLREIADCFHFPIHMDGARIFNAAEALGVSVIELCQYADSVMFCLSKGLGAPIGSLLCGSRNFIIRAKQLRKTLGGGMRQAGIIAAPGIYALTHNRERLGQDRKRAEKLAESLRKSLTYIHVQKNVQTNIIMLYMPDGRITAGEFCSLLKGKGLIAGPVGDRTVRLVIYKGISDEDIAVAEKRIAEAEREIMSGK